MWARRRPSSGSNWKRAGWLAAGWRCTWNYAGCRSRGGTIWNRRPTARRAEFTTDSALWLLAALAFEMAREGNFQSVSRDQMAEFSRRVWQRHRDECDWQTQPEFKRQLQLLGCLNEFMDHAVSYSAELQDVHWKNRTLQEFSAGLWMSYYASEADHA